MFVGRAYLIMRSVIKDTEFPVFDGYMLASDSASELTSTGFLYSTVFEIAGKDFQDACNSFMNMIYEINDPFFISLRPWFPRTYEEHKDVINLQEKIRIHQNLLTKGL